MAVRLFYRFGSSNGVFPAFPLDSSIYVAPVGRPEHTDVQRHGGHIIKDEGERVLVTGEIETVTGLTNNQEQDTQEKQYGIFETQEDQQRRNPWKVRLHFAEDRPRGAAHQPIEIFLPALPHGMERAVHADADDPFAGTERDPMARSFSAHGDRKA